MTMSTFDYETETDSRGVEYVEDFDESDTLPDGWALCGACHRAWNDSISTSVTPAPSARCPFEDKHEPDIWQLLDSDAPSGCDAIQSLYSWSLNYDAGKGPFALFLDLIGWSEDNIGDSVWSGTPATSLGYVELSKLADALSAYSDRPQDVRSYVDELMNAETRG